MYFARLARTNLLGSHGFRALPTGPRQWLCTSAAMSSGVDVHKWLEDNQITRRGQDLPNPLFTFEDAQWPNWVLRNVRSSGFQSPTVIQSLAWGVTAVGRDMIGIAATGSGKTLGFAIPSLMALSERPRMRDEGPAVVVIAPTRELAQQITAQYQSLLQGTKYKTVCLFGGSPRGHQVSALRRGVDVVVCTAGRMNDLMESGDVVVDNVKYLVLDEADRMLDMGFEEQIRSIIEPMPAMGERRTLMFSATWPEDVRALARDYMNDSVQITVGSDQLQANKRIKQQVVSCPDYKKEEMVLDYLQQSAAKKILLFSKTKRGCEKLCTLLRANGIPAASIHGDKSQRERDVVLNAFRVRQDGILCATDVAARGLDVNDIQLVINYDMPLQIEDYIHRIGRTARYEASGESFSLFAPSDSSLGRALVGVLKDADQEVPDFLQAYNNKFSSSSGRSKYRKGGSSFGYGGNKYGGRGGGRGDGGYRQSRDPFA